MVMDCSFNLTALRVLWGIAGAAVASTVVLFFLATRDQLEKFKTVKKKQNLKFPLAYAPLQVCFGAILYAVQAIAFIAMKISDPTQTIGVNP